MFDVSFSELLMIGVIALVVIGPQRLPKMARTIGHLVGRAQRYVSDVKSDIQREMDLDEITSLKSQLQDAAKTIKDTVKTTGDDLRKPLDEAQNALKEASDSLKSATASTEAATPAIEAAAEAVSDSTTPLEPLGEPLGEPLDEPLGTLGEPVESLAESLTEPQAEPLEARGEPLDTIAPLDEAVADGTTPLEPLGEPTSKSPTGTST